MTKLKRMLGTALLLALGAMSALGADFTQADLEKMVKELDAVLPHNESYVYPIKCSIVDKDELNAYASLTREEGQTKPRPVMVVFTGLVKQIGGDQRLIRAVVAHELSHISLGHSIDINPAARDIKNLWVRQQEFEADATGAAALQRSGHAKQDMCDMLLFLAKSDGRKSGDWLGRMTADHADPKARAAEVAANPMVLKALCTFDVALAYYDNRDFQMAMNLFDAAAMQEPKLTDAYINSGKSALMFYYDLLGEAIRNQQWWRPDFGPMLFDPTKENKDPAMRAEDKERYQEALKRITIAVTKAPNSTEAKESLALAQVLDPDGEKAAIQKGIDWFKAALAGTSDQVLKLRYANNAAVGLHRLGNVQGAFDTIMSAQRGNDYFNSAVGENLGRVTITNPSQDTAKIAASVVYTWLSDTPPSSPNWGTVKKSFDDLLEKGGFKGMEIKQKPTYLCRVMSLTTSGKELGLLVPENSYYDALGKADLRITFTDRFPDLAEIRWKGGDIAVFTERSQIMRVTSYQDGSFITLKPVDTTLQQTYKISVGMTEAELAQVLNPKAGAKKDLARGGKTEEWTYFQALNFGVYVKDGKVRGLTVTPVYSS